MKRDTLSAIKFRGIASSVLSICCYLIIWACCELLHDITMRGFFAVAAVIVAIIFASMIFKLSATKMISDISASKVFNAYRAMFFAYVIYAALLGAMLFYSLNYTGLASWDYALQQNGSSFEEAFYCTIAALYVGLEHLSEIGKSQIMALWSTAIITLTPIVIFTRIYTPYLLGKASGSKIFYIYAVITLIWEALLKLLEILHVDKPWYGSAPARYAALAVIILSEILELIAWIRIKGISGAELWNKNLWTTPTK
ncbi:hypothetical protein [uncultured Campylobacter sp.]|uniref:hypothetical protein n=1 Tax=uncultured Campylobacter sp. TaxID=218934 RepID=UPI002636C50F|nr:hypothetical protein [uncultured Campylobacter sp.]